MLNSLSVALKLKQITPQETCLETPIASAQISQKDIACQN